MAYCPPDYLATGSFDGELVVWSVDMEREVSRFQSMAKIKQTLLYVCASNNFYIQNSVKKGHIIYKMHNATYVHV